MPKRQESITFPENENIRKEDLKLAQEELHKTVKMRKTRRVNWEKITLTKFGFRAKSRAHAIRGFARHYWPIKRREDSLQKDLAPIYPHRGLPKLLALWREHREDHYEDTGSEQSMRKWELPYLWGEPCETQNTAGREGRFTGEISIKKHYKADHPNIVISSKP